MCVRAHEGASRDFPADEVAVAACAHGGVHATGLASVPGSGLLNLRSCMWRLWEARRPCPCPLQSSVQVVW